MRAKRLLLGLVGLALLPVVIRVYSGWRPWSAMNFWPGPEDSGIRVVEAAGGYCHRLSHFDNSPYLWDANPPKNVPANPMVGRNPWLQEVMGDPVVEVAPYMGHFSKTFGFLTDAELAQLSSLKQLQILNLWFSAVTDAGLKELRAFPNLHCLDLSFTAVTDAGLKELAALRSLRSLRLFSTKVTDAGLLIGLPQLKELELGASRVTDAGLEDLAKIEGLEDLGLCQTAVSDAGLKKLTGLRQLKKLDLRGTRVTDAGIQQLKQALPRCRILLQDSPGVHIE